MFDHDPFSRNLTLVQAGIEATNAVYFTSVALYNACKKDHAQDE
jgi:hypothetical protein